MPVVELHQVTRAFGTVRAVDGLTWNAQAGQITAVLGPNGAGKSTSMEIAEGLQHADSGTVRVLGTDPWKASPQHRARVGVMLQDGGLPQASKPLPLLRLLASMYAQPASIDDLASRLRINEFAATTVRRLSGGQRQRLALAAALIGRPDVAFLDEPTAGLDPHGRLEVWQMLRDQRDAGTSLIVTTHSFEEAQRLADSVVVVHRGRCQAQGSPQKIAAQYGNGSLEDAYFSLTGVQA